MKIEKKELYVHSYNIQIAMPFVEFQMKEVWDSKI